MSALWDNVQRSVLVREIDEVVNTLQNFARNFGGHAGNPEPIVAAARCIREALARKNKLLFCGNGGSAADSQHLAAEFMGRYLRERHPQPAIALTVDTSVLTAIANDYDFKSIFSRQVAGLGREGDVLVALSTSGRSENILEALHTARQLGITTIGLTGASGGEMRGVWDILICTPAERPDRVQELHIATGHILCDLVEATL